MLPPLLAALLLTTPVTVVENLNQPLPPELRFVNQDGEAVTLARYFKPDRPVVITPVYYTCPVLCSSVLRGVVTVLEQTGFKLGTDYEVITFSIDPKETPEQAAKKRRELALGWDFLTGDEANIRRLTESLGFQYRYDSEIKQFVHAASFMVLTPDGRISRYLYGARFERRDVRLALVEAADGRVGTAFDRFILTCTKYDPIAGRYELYVWGMIRGGGMLVFVALACLLGVLWRRELRRPA